MRNIPIRLFWFSVVSLLCAAAAAPATTAKLLRGQIVYSPPADWELSIGSSNENTAAWAQTEGSGILAIQALPANAVVDQGAGKAIVKQLRENHVKARDQILLDPKLIDDDRFAIEIHERYKHAGKVSDELHLYKMVGPRPCMLTVNAQTEDETEAKNVHKVGEDVLLSAKFVKAKSK